MLIRAMIGGGISVGLMGLSQSALQLTVLRGIQGASSGTVAAATALVATETPAAHLAWGLGILSSAISLGSAVGPAAGGLATTFIGLRAIFLAGGAMLLLAAIPVLFVVRESPRPMVRTEAPRTMDVLRLARAGTVGALAVLIVAQGLQQTSIGAAQQLLVLRLLEMTGAQQAQSFTGLAFAAAGIATALASLTYHRLLRRTTYRRLLIAGALLLGLALLWGGAPTPPVPPIAALLLPRLFCRPLI